LRNTGVKERNYERGRGRGDFKLSLSMDATIVILARQKKEVKYREGKRAMKIGKGKRGRGGIYQYRFLSQKNEKNVFRPNKD